MSDLPIATRSAFPSARMASANCGSLMRPTATTGTPTMLLIPCASGTRQPRGKTAGWMLM
jgi:hypothetical protein